MLCFLSSTDASGRKCLLKIFFQLPSRMFLWALCHCVLYVDCPLAEVFKGCLTFSLIAKPSLCIGGKNKYLFGYHVTHHIVHKYLHRFLLCYWNCIYFLHWDQVLCLPFTCYYYFTVNISGTVLGPKYIGRECLWYQFNDWQRRIYRT